MQQEWIGSVPVAVEFGEPFELELRRSWPVGWQPEAWSLAAFAPYEAELLTERKRERSGRVEVYRSLRLRVFALGEQSLQLRFAATDPANGANESASVLALASVVHSSLPHGDLGPIELPAELAAPRPVHLGRRFGAVGLVIALIAGFTAAAWWRRRRIEPSQVQARTDVWAQFRVVQELPRSTESERRAALQAARSLVRSFEAKQTWTAPELAQRLSRRFALPRTETASLLHFLHETEAAVFADQQEVVPALDPAFDELAEVLRVVEPEGPR